MGRPAKQRDDYSQDAVTLLRIRRALLADEARPLAWREAHAASLLQVSNAFTADAERTATHRSAEAKKARRR